MKQGLHHLLKDLRLRSEKTQNEVAEFLGVSRTSYLNLEQGKRKPSFEEMKKLAELYKREIWELDPEMREKQGKFKQMLLFLVQKVGESGKLTKTKLAKMLYLADFAWFYHHHEPMSGLHYRKIHYGPVPDYFFRLYDELASEGKIKIEFLSGRNGIQGGASLTKNTPATRLEKCDLLGREEKALLTKVAKKWINKGTDEIVAFTHNQIPYAFTDKNTIIDYRLITQEDPENVF